jgi:hypothetical protein
MWTIKGPNDTLVKDRYNPKICLLFTSKTEARKALKNTAFIMNPEGCKVIKCAVQVYYDKIKNK